MKDDGQFENKPQDFDSVQKTLNRTLQNIYPRAAYFPKLIRDGTSHAPAIIVPGSELRAHFSGPSFFRLGWESIEVSQAQFDTLIAMRISKLYRLAQHIGKQVTVINNSLLGNGTFMQGNGSTVPTKADCNEFWITLQSPGEKPRPFPLRGVELNFDNQRDRLQLEITTRQFKQNGGRCSPPWLRKEESPTPSFSSKPSNVATRGAVEERAFTQPWKAQL